MLEYTRAQVEDLRDLRYRRSPSLRVTSEEQALTFVNEVGFCFLFGDQSVEIPTLFSAVSGSRREMPNDHYDSDVGRTWDWKDSLPVRGLVYYGKLLRGKPTLVSLELLPSFYALSDNYGDLYDYEELYREGKLSVEAKAVYELLLNEGAMPTTHLRKKAGLWGGGAIARRFERAVAELQVGMQIVKVGIADCNRWGYAYVYDLFLRRFPEVPEAARRIAPSDARATLLERHLRNVVVQTEEACQRLFHWEARDWQSTVARLRAGGRLVSDVRLQGTDQAFLALA